MFKKIQVQEVFKTNSQYYRRTHCSVITHWDKLSVDGKKWKEVSTEEQKFLQRNYDNQVEIKEHDRKEIS